MFCTPAVPAGKRVESIQSSIIVALCFDVLQQGYVQQRRESSLKYQTRCIKCFPNKQGGYEDTTISPKTHTPTCIQLSCSIIILLHITLLPLQYVNVFWVKAMQASGDIDVYNRYTVISRQCYSKQGQVTGQRPSCVLVCTGPALLWVTHGASYACGPLVTNFGPAVKVFTSIYSSVCSWQTLLNTFYKLYLLYRTVQFM